MVKKATYSSAQLMRLLKSTLGEINSDRKLRAFKMDSGASKHVVNNLKLFETFKPSWKQYIELANVTKSQAKGKDTVTVNNYGIRITLSNVHHTSALKLNLMSCSRLDEKKVTTTNSKYQCELFDRDARNRVKGRLPGRDRDGLFVTYIESSSSTGSRGVKFSTSMNAVQQRRESIGSASLWHKKMGHGTEIALNEVITSKRHEMLYNDTTADLNFMTCTHMKQEKALANGELLERVQNITINADMCDAMSTETLGKRKMLPPVDNQSTPIFYSAAIDGME